jgi:hypothetical protein
MGLHHKNMGRLIEGYTIIIGIGVAIALAGIIAFGALLMLTIPWFSIPLIFVFLGIWIAASQWNEVGKLRVIAGFAASVTLPTQITAASNLLSLKKFDFVRGLTKLITRGVIEIDIFPEVDTFGPRGMKLSESVPKDYQPVPITPTPSHQRITSSLQWIGVIGTIIAIIYHIVGLIRFLGFF